MRNDEELALIQVGPGTPSGDVFRRYWIPVEVSAALGGGRGGFSGALNPIKLTVLGEHLILFRDSYGAPHLMEEHCSHRGTSLSYGRVEGDCIRCLYHGWLYDGDGNVVEMPGEPPENRFNERVKHVAYPCREVAGLIFAYMGPAELEPLFPRYHQLFSEDGVRVTGNGGYVEQCNVFQALHDNNMDPWHGEIAHGWYRNPPRVGTMQQAPRREAGDAGDVRAYALGHANEGAQGHDVLARPLPLPRDAHRLALAARQQGQRRRHQVGDTARRLPDALVRRRVLPLRRRQDLGRRARRPSTRPTIPCPTSPGPRTCRRTGPSRSGRTGTTATSGGRATSGRTRSPSRPRGPRSATTSQTGRNGTSASPTRA